MSAPAMRTSNVWTESVVVATGGWSQVGACPATAWQSNGTAARPESSVNPACSVRQSSSLLGAAGAASDLAIDAFVVAVGDLNGGAVVATVDVGDMERLAVHAAHVHVADIGS